MHHFVNGGGGAYLSFGTSLAWPAKPADGRLGVLSRTVTAVTRRSRPRRRGGSGRRGGGRGSFGAWPFTAEWLSAAFDYNVAPFFQSFVEVRVEPSANRIVLRPYGVHGRLTWGDLASSESIRPAGVTARHAGRVGRADVSPMTDTIMAKRGDLDVPVIGVAKAGWTLDQLRARAQDSVEKYGGLDRAAFDKLFGLLRYVDGDYNDPATFEALRRALGDAQHPAHYLAIPPSLFGPVVEQLAQSGCATGCPRRRRETFRPMTSLRRAS